jgi:NitT/TauT family transport system substrate-binding protein
MQLSKKRIIYINNLINGGKRVKNVFNLFLLIMILGFALVGCGSIDTSGESSGDNTTDTNNENVNEEVISSDEEPEIKELTIVGGLDAQTSAQLLIAEELGYFEEEGIKVNSHLIQNSVDIGPMIAGGSAPVSFEANITDIILAASNVDVSIVAPMAQIAGTQGLVKNSDTVINSAKDLEGMTIGMQNGAGVQIAIKNMAKDLGVDIEKLEFINLAPNEQISALEHGDIDVMAAWEPFITKSINMGNELLFTGKVSNIPEKQGDVEWMSFHSTLQVTDDFLEENPNTIKAIIRGLMKATDYINENREESIKILAPILQLEEDELREVMKRNVYSMTLDESFISGSDEIANFLVEVGTIQQAPELTDYVNFELLTEVAPQLVETEIPK